MIVTGRNDNYMGNFKYRLTASLNYISYQLKELGYINNVEILITDWNSKIPLSEVLMLTPEAASMCQFIHVPPEIAIKKMRLDQVFHSTCAVNVGIQRACGSFVVHLTADMIIPKLSLRNLLELLEGDISIPYEINSCIFFIPTKKVPWDVIYKEPDYLKLNQYIILNSAELEIHGKYWTGTGMGSCHLMSKSLWDESRGYNENMSDWGIKRLNNGENYSLISFSTSTTSSVADFTSSLISCLAFLNSFNP